MRSLNLEVAVAAEPGVAAISASPIYQPVAQNFGSSRPSWRHVIAHLDPKYGGVSAVVPQLDAAIADAGHYSVGLTAFCTRGEEYMPPPAPFVSVSHLPLARGDWKRRPVAAVEFKSAIDSSAGVHIHGLWQRSTALAAKLARQSCKPYLVSAHGMLERWALANKKWKKQIYLAFIEKQTLSGAACLHALTTAEVDDYRRIGLRNPVAVIPNGVTIPEQPSPETFLNSFPELRGKRLVLFLGRIHFKKGLDILSRAWAQVAALWPDAHLVLAGPDFENTQANVEQTLRDMKVSDRVTFTGMLTGERKWSALAAATFFVLPSYSEGLSVSVLEAMGMAKPVLITENCNLPEVESAGAGIVIKANLQDLQVALNDMLGSSCSALTGMGSRGAHLVRTRYSWQAIGQQMTDLYNWLEGGAQPGNVQIDMPGGLR